MKVRQMVIAAAAMLAASSAMACGTDCPPPPPPELNACSPGFWKNHTGLWFNDAPCSQTAGMCDRWLQELKSRGPGSSVIRDARTDYLNAWADGYYLRVVCPNE